MSSNDYFNLDEFINFFYSVYGSNPEIKCIDQKPDISLDNRSRDNILVDKLYSSIKKHSVNISQEVVSTQTINVICGDKTTKVDPKFLEYRGHKYNILGMKKEGTGCVTGGCCPEVHQIAKIKLAAVQKSVLEETVNIANTVMSEIKQTTNLTVGCQKLKYSLSDGASIDKSTQQTVYNRVRELINKEINVNYSPNQTINFHYKSPLLCVNECDKEPSSSSITQELNIRILSANIIDAVKEIIDKTNIQSYSETDVSFTADQPFDDSFKSYSYAIGTVILTIIIYIIFVIITYFILSLIAFKFFRVKWLEEGTVPGIFPRWALHLITWFVIYLIVKLWEFIKCVYNNPIKLITLECSFGVAWWEKVLIWIKCLAKKIIKFIIKIIFSVPPLDRILPLVEKALGMAAAVADVGNALVGSATAIFSGKDPFKEFSKKMREKDPCVSEKEIEKAFGEFLIALAGKPKTCDDIRNEGNTY